jgi:hypothetical protein
MNKSFLVTAQVGGTTRPKRRPRGRKQFFFEKKNQKTSPNQGSLYPERPQPKQSKDFCCFFLTEKSFLPSSSLPGDRPGQYRFLVLFFKKELLSYS